MQAVKNPSYDGNYTREQFSALQEIYNYFNRQLFGGALNDCILNFSRKSKAYGFFVPKRWGRRTDANGAIHEISLNPEHLKRHPREVLSTLVHEMAHLWQQDFGKPTPCYHNRQWAAKMKELGLHPSNTGQPGGREIGKNMSHFIVAGGPYETAFQNMPENLMYPFVCMAEPGKDKKERDKKKNKTKYTCPACDANIWGKPGLQVRCMDCNKTFLETE